MRDDFKSAYDLVIERLEGACFPTNILLYKEWAKRLDKRGYECTLIEAAPKHRKQLYSVNKRIIQARNYNKGMRNSSEKYAAIFMHS